jgi:hypothetical protein
MNLHNAYQAVDCENESERQDDREPCLGFKIQQNYRVNRSYRAGKRSTLALFKPDTADLVL